MSSQGRQSTGETIILRADPTNPDPCLVKELKATLECGGIVAYPTETLYGLGVDPFLKDSVARLYRLKRRPVGMPLSILVRDMEMVHQLVSSIPPVAEKLIQTFFPGPLTLVLRARHGLPEELTGGTGKIGIRISSHPLIKHLFSFHASPVTTTSANPTGLPPATDATMVQRYFPKGLDCILDGGPVFVGKPSTVVDLSGHEPVVLRDGAISRGDLSRVMDASFGIARIS